MKELGLILLSYLLGGVPFGLIVGKVLCGVDIRQSGSGNIGATNVFRTLGPGPGALVFAADVLKGLLPVLGAVSLFPGRPWMAVSVGLVAILGHTFSVFLGFRGGKGVATSLGVIIGLSPTAAAVGFGIWLIVVLTTRYVSVASITAVLCVAGLMWAVRVPPAYRIFTTVAAAFVILKHRSNISRLLRGDEHRFGRRA